MKYKRWLVIFALILPMIVLPIYSAQTNHALADVGGGVSHDYDGADDFFNGSNSGGSDSGGFFGGSGDSDYSGGGGDGDITDLIFIFYLVRDNPALALILLVFFLIPRIRNKRRRSNSRNTRSTQRPGNRNHATPSQKEVERLRAAKPDLSRLMEKDPAFSQENFISRINNMFIQLQTAWMDKQWSSIRPFETDALFNMHKQQLQTYIDRNQTNVVENIAILDSKIVRYNQSSDYDEIDVYLQVRLNDYVRDDDTGKVVKGDPNRDVYMVYVWTLIRKGDVKTEKQTEEYEVTQCPNCAANVSINQSGECEYCGSTISSGQYNWVLSKIKVVNQR